jgi:GDPmannose 4,6-dehydratase
MKQENRKTAVITGVTGQDGSWLLQQLLDKDYFVVGAKRRTSNFNSDRIEHLYTHKNFKIEYFDLKDSCSINNLIAKYKPDEYYNLAAQSHVKVSFDVPEDTMSGIIFGVLYALEAIKNISPKTKFYQASSSEMFGDNKNAPFDEESKFCPASPYAVAKVTAHNLVRNYRESYNLHASCGILFNHESELRGQTFVTRKISTAVANIKLGFQQKLELGNLYAYRDWGYAPEYTNMMWKMLQQDTPDDYVISTDETHTVEEFVKEIFELAELDYKNYLNINPLYFRPHEVPYLKGNSKKAKQMLGWNPKITFKQLAKHMYNYDLEYIRRKNGN